MDREARLRQIIPLNLSPLFSAKCAESFDVGRRRSVRPMRRRSEHKVVGRDGRGRPLNVAASVSAK